MDDVSVWPYLVSFFAVVVGSIIGWFGSYHVHHRLQRREKRIEALRENWKDFHLLVCDYWSIETDPKERRAAESRIIIRSRVVNLEHEYMAENDSKIEESFNETKELRLRILDEAMGGPFEQSDWTVDLERAKSVSFKIMKVLRTLD